jgi:hypothetical protein
MMNEGWLAIGVILATIGSAVALVWYRDLIFTTGAAAPRRPRRSTPRRPAAARPRAPRQAETPAKPAEVVSTAISVIAAPENDIEMIAFRALAKLIRAGAVNETVAIETVFDVKAGSSKAYKTAQSNLKKALNDLDSLN